jgi:hypothetical protein
MKCIVRFSKIDDDGWECVLVLDIKRSVLFERCDTNFAEVGCMTRKNRERLIPGLKS